MYLPRRTQTSWSEIQGKNKNLFSYSKTGETNILPLDVDFINETRSVANPDPTPRIASIDNLSTLKMYLWNVGHGLFAITQNWTEQ